MSSSDFSPTKRRIWRLGRQGGLEEHLHFRSHHQRGATPYRGTPPSSSSSLPSTKLLLGVFQPGELHGRVRIEELSLPRRPLSNPAKVKFAG
ncbi:hypothetical protein CEXT_96331 [Caerostris extrusa]|uniref:Uncharacterized protein n=1 Tax=Caerostris extrusa TaxID=172846 RepID=A0AAV4P391_CAEEX|nr:hypothetical protein CEXT_96331 [Caerostris extrusa]